jgi:hypothetical protein
MITHNAHRKSSPLKNNMKKKLPLLLLFARIATTEGKQEMGDKREEEPAFV